MKIRDGYMVREVAGTTVVVPLAADSSFNGMLKLNETGKFLWDALAKGAELDELVAGVLEEYDIDEATARADVEKFVESLKGVGALEY